MSSTWSSTSAAICVAAVAVLGLAGPCPAGVTTPYPLYSYFEGLRGRLPLETPATPDDPLAFWINPAMLGTGRASGVGYIHTYSDSGPSGDDALALSLGSVAFGAEFMRTSDRPFSPQTGDTRRYTLAAGQRLYRDLYLGTSYSWHKSELAGLDKATTWSVGLLARPHEMLSLGVVGRDLNSPRHYGVRSRPILETSLGFRPVGDRLTFFADYLARGHELEACAFCGDALKVKPQPKSFFAFGVEIEPVRGVFVRVGSNQDDNVSTSISLAIGNLGLGSIQTRNRARHGHDRTYGTATVTTSPFWRENIFQPRNSYLEIDMHGSIGETKPPFSLLGGGPTYGLRELLERIARAKRSPEVTAIVLKCSGVSANLSILDELRQGLLDFRSSGKQVIAFTESPGNGEYYLASASDYVILAPNGYLGLVGLKAEGVFLKGTLDKMGVRAEFAKAGKYKSAVELFTQTQSSEASLEAENALLDDIYAKFVGDIAAGRRMTEEKARDAIDSGPYIPAEAYKAGLVDTVAYWDQVPDIVAKVRHAGSRSLPYSSFAGRTYLRARWDEPPSIGIVYALGSIVTGRNRGMALVGDLMGSDTMAEAIKAMREDGSVKAVVLRVDSPGGMMAASDVIRREIELTRKQKPVIVSMGGVAASGGYHISCAASKIIADEATVTGSIGVFNLWFHTRGLYEKLGANKEIMTRGNHADAMPTWRDVTEDDIKLVQYFVDRYYEKFVNDVAAGRGIAFDTVDAIAQGRVWSGRAAYQRGLVDGIGGLEAAIGLARAEAGIPEDEEVAFKVLPAPGGLFSRLMSGAQSRILGRVEVPEELKAMVKDSAFLSEFDEPFLYLAPCTIEIK